MKDSKVSDRLSTVRTELVGRAAPGVVSRRGAWRRPVCTDWGQGRRGRRKAGAPRCTGDGRRAPRALVSVGD